MSYSSTVFYSRHTYFALNTYIFLIQWTGGHVTTHVTINECQIVQFGKAQIYKLLNMIVMV